LSKKSKRKLDKRREQEFKPFEADNDSISIPVVREKTVMAPLLDQAEVNWLIKCSDEPYKGPKQEARVKVEYATYNQYEAEALQAAPISPKKTNKKK